MLTYKLPTSIDEAVQALAEAGEAVSIVGGGTVTVPEIATGTSGFTDVVDLSQIDMSSITVAGDRIEIGAGVKIAQLLAHEELKFLHQVAAGIAGPAIRNMATVGGNLCYVGDLAAAFLALGAEVVLHSGSGETNLSLAEYYQDQATHDGIISLVRFSKSRADTFGYYKLTRRKLNSAVIVAAAVSDSGSGVLIGLLGADDGPLLLSEKTDLLSTDISTEQIDQRIAGQLSGTPPTDYHATSNYRRQMIPLVIKRAISDAIA